jgi:hypothetical protein
MVCKLCSKGWAIAAGYEPPVKEPALGWRSRKRTDSKSRGDGAFAPRGGAVTGRDKPANAEMFFSNPSFIGILRRDLNRMSSNLESH